MAAPLETHVFGTTLMPRRAMARFYAPLVRSLPPGPVHHWAMPELGGLGRTDRVVARLAAALDDVRRRGARARLVGHSLGGVVAWVLAHENRDVVEEVELYATPVRGTALTNGWLPVAEARFLMPGSRWLRTYDRPLNGPRVRSVYSFCDVWVTPARRVSSVEGERATNHFVVPFRVRPRSGEQRYRGALDHIGLPRHRGLLAALRRYG